MRKKCRCLLSLLLAVVMVAAMMPAALAADDSAADTAFKNGPYLLAPKTDSMVVVWESTEPGTSTIAYGTSEDSLCDPISVEVNADAPDFQGQKMNVNSGDPLGILGDYVLGITLWQITTYNKVMSLLKEHDREYLEVYRIIGEIDAAVSTASFRRSLPWYCTPEECEENQIIMEDIYHPLLSNPVENSLSLDRGCLITGSNASGKSTFIKAAAVNAILGQALNTCAARGMRMPRMQVLTSMAVKDDLMEGESYFIREIRYLQIRTALPWWRLMTRN